MKPLLTAIFILFIGQLSAQDTVKCTCSKVFKFSQVYPKKAEENKISGQVVIEMDRDSLCLLSNPTVIRGLGYGCDEEAIRIIKLWIAFHNYCTLERRRFMNCTKAKVSQIITFDLPPE